jgi:hypothetical protein
MMKHEFFLNLRPQAVTSLRREPFDAMVGAATVEELKERGWDGELGE